MISESGSHSQAVEALPAPAPPARPTVDPGEVTIHPHRPGFWETMKEVVAHRRFAFAMAGTAVGRHIRKYRLGATWTVLSAFMSVLGYSVIFGGGVFTVKTPHHMPYFMYLLVGMMGFRLFQSTLNESNRSFLRLKKLHLTFHFPMVLIPTVGASYALFEFSLNVLLYLGCVVYYWAARGTLYAQLSPKLMLMSIAGLGLCLAFAWGVGLWTGPMVYWARDVRMIIGFLMPFYMLLTPVMYPVQSLHGPMRMFAEANPLTSAVEMGKVGLLGVGAVNFWGAIWSISFISALLVSGTWFTNRYGPVLVSGSGNPYDDGVDDDDML